MQATQRATNGAQSVEHGTGVNPQQRRCPAINSTKAKDGMYPIKHTGRTVAYMRVSTDEQTVETQKLAVDSLIKSVMGPDYDMNEVLWFIEEDGVSAYKKAGLEKRPQGRRLFDAIKADEVGILFCHRTDRLFRNVEEGSRFVSMMKKHPLHFFATDFYGLDVATSTGLQMMIMNLLNAELESMRTGERTSLGHLRNRTQLKPTSDPPYGWDAIDTGEFNQRKCKKTGEMLFFPVREMKPNWDEQSVKHWARRENRKYDKSWTAIASQLNRYGVSTKNHGKWHHQTVIRTCLKTKYDDELHRFDQPSDFPNYWFLK